MMETASTSDTSINFYKTARPTTQKTAFFILAAVRTSNLTQKNLYTCREANPCCPVPSLVTVLTELKKLRSGQKYVGGEETGEEEDKTNLKYVSCRPSLSH
jgi:hypothetical protein